MTRFLLTLALFTITFSSISAQQEKVLIIGIDGCRPDALRVANTPNIDQLIANGLYSPDALNNDITSSGPGWSAILTGVRSEKHGVTDNSFAGSNYAAYPPIFARVEAFDEDLVTASIVHWDPINDQIVLNTADFKLNVGSDQAVEDQAELYLTNNDPDLLFLHFDDVDHAGHAEGYAVDNPPYLASIENVDTHVGVVMAALNSRPNIANEDWLILLTPDHGGINFGHGGSSIDEERIFFIASNSAITPDTIFKDSTIITIANCLSTSTELQFAGTNDQVAVPYASQYDFGAGRDFTIECRVRTTQSADVAIVGNKDWDTGVNDGFVFSFKLPSGPEWKVNVGDGTNRADLNLTGNIIDGAWHTLSVTFDRDGMMSAYEDGSFVGETSMANVGDIDNGNGLFFGTDINSAYDFTGTIAEIRVWDGLLSAATITDWACKSLTSSHPQFADLEGYWPLTEGSGTTAADQSTFANTGAIVGADWAVSGTSVTYDYSATPRLEDITPTALNHLCVPIPASWNLDGQSRIPVCASLPVAWESFSAVRTKEFEVNLSWTTSEDDQNRGFVVERSVDGRNWSDISIYILSARDQNYHFTDHQAVNNQYWYYRIRQMDFDEAVDYSNIQYVAPDPEKASLKVFPNPSRGYFTVRLPFDESADLRLLDLNGREVWHGKTNRVTFKGPPGVYLLTARTASDLWIKKVVIE